MILLMEKNLLKRRTYIVEGKHTLIVNGDKQKVEQIIKFEKKNTKENISFQLREIKYSC